MLIGITGTPGTGKTSIADFLKNHGFVVIDLNTISKDKGFVVSYDEERDSNIVDLDRLDDYIKDSFGDEEFVVLDGHLSHLLKCVEKIVILRCFPVELGRRLSCKGWSKGKIRENVEAEILDIILCESLENIVRDDIFEIDTTDLSINDVGSMVLEIIDNDFKPMKKYKIGKIDWSEEILKDF